MEINVVEILKIGLPGLVFLLSLLSYNLLRKEQNKTKPNGQMLKYIEHFMYVNILLAVLTAASPIIEYKILKKEVRTTFDADAQISMTEFDKYEAAVCKSAEYGGRYLLIMDPSKKNMIQVRGNGILPCDEDVITLNEGQAKMIGLTNREDSMRVGVSVAEQGQQFVMGSSITNQGDQ